MNHFNLNFPIKPILDLRTAVPPEPPEGNFLLLDGTPFLLLDGTNFELFS